MPTERKWGARSNDFDLCARSRQSSRVGEIQAGVTTYNRSRANGRTEMIGPLTYPPEIVIESKIDLPADLPADFGQEHTGVEVYFEFAMMMIEIVAGLLDRL